MAAVLLLGPAQATANGGGAPSGATVVTQTLYDQNDLPYGIGAYSNVGGPTGMYDALAADEFAVPTGQTWIISQVKVTGSTAAGEGCGTATSVTVSFFADDSGYPGALVHASTVTPADGLVQSACSFTVPLAGTSLAAGHYWLAVQAADAGGWFWRMRGNVLGSGALWQNPDGGWAQGCTSWGLVRDCYDVPGSIDLMFGLYGSKTANGKAVLYDQPDLPTSGGIPSFLTYMNGTSEAADDFTIPASTTWHLTSVSVPGYGNGLTSPVELRIYHDVSDAPDVEVYSTTIPVGSFEEGPPPSEWGNVVAGTLMLPVNPLPLPSGHYWLSVQATGADMWQWSLNSNVSDDPAMWKGDRPGCATWQPLATCFPNIILAQYPKDLVFTLFGTNPHVTSVTTTVPNGVYTTGATIPVTIAFDQPVTVTGTPRLHLGAGLTGWVDYQSGSGTTTLTFAYVVQSGDSSAALDYTSTDALQLNGGTIRNPDGDDAQTALPAPGSPGSLGANSDVVIDTWAPSIMMTRPEDGSFFFQGSTVTAEYSCADEPGGSGLASCVGTVANGSPIDMTVGMHEFDVTATDNVGNHFTMRYFYTVAKPVVLWNQADAASPAGGVASSYGPAGMTLAADDFVVPAGESWALAEIDVAGLGALGTDCGTAAGAFVVIFTDPADPFGTVVAASSPVGPSDGLVQTGCSLAIPANVGTLAEGHYWLAVLAIGADWSWQARAGIYGEEALAATVVAPADVPWQTVSATLGAAKPLDLMFTLRGTGAGDDILTPTDGAPLSAAPGDALSGVALGTFTDSNPGATAAADFTATVCWGDGTGCTTGVIDGSGGSFSVSGSHTFSSAGDYTVVTTVADDKGATATIHTSVNVALPVIPPREVVVDVRDTLAALTPPDKATRDKLAQAIKLLDASLVSSLWHDATHPSLTSGNKVFDRQRDAVRALMAIRNPDPAVTDAITRLVAETRLLATTAIDEAAGGKADRLKKAAQELAAGDKELKARHYNKAIERYRNAWLQAIAA